ncbi:MAG TPA: hypothetical protein VGQ02_00435 [Candidatus Limnocylindrales bacterium]|nr:hypothetical protein [Candidatus Limnocylindrales bacterium]
MRRLMSLAAGAGVALSLAAGSVAAGGPPAVGFYVDGSLYRTVGTPTDLSGTGPPAHSYDTIYALGGDLLNVAEAKPGDRDYNGGRWMVRAIEWHTSPTQLTSAEQVLAAEADGDLTIGGVVKSFECPVIKIPGGSG